MSSFYLGSYLDHHVNSFLAITLTYTRLSYLYKVNYKTNEMVEITDSYPELRSPVCAQYNGMTSIYYFNPEHNTLLIQCDYMLSSTATGMVDIYLLDGDTGEMHFMADGMDTFNMRFPQQPSNINPAYFNFLKSKWDPDWEWSDEHHHEFWRVDGEVPVKEYEITFESGTTSFVGQMSADNWFYFSQLEEGKEVLKGLNLNGEELTGPSVDYHQHSGFPLSTKYSNLVVWSTSHAENVISPMHGIIFPEYIEDLQVWDKDTGIIRTFAWEHSQSYYAMASIMAGDPEGRFVVYLGFTEGATIFYKDLYSAGILDENGHLIEGD